MLCTLSSLSTDPTFTTENISTVWEVVAVDKRKETWEEGFGKSNVEEVYSRLSSEEERLQRYAMMYYAAPYSSWKDLIEWLYSSGELAAAKKAKTFLQQKGE